MATKSVTSEPPSVLKRLYLLLFLYAAVSGAFGFHSNLGVIWKNQLVNNASTDHDYSALVILSVLFWIMFVLHLLRVYVLVELLEDPCSREHKEYLIGLAPWQRRLEQSLRTLVVASVSWKVITPGNDLVTLGAFLVGIYSSLLLWDLCIGFGNSNIKLRETFVKSSFFGLAGSILLWYGATVESQYLSYAAFVVLSLVVMSVVVEGDKAEWKHWISHLITMLGRILWPGTEYGRCGQP